MSKVLITTGYGSNEFEDGQHSEVLDLLNPNLVCDPLPNYPSKVLTATGGLLLQQWPIICGGYNDEYLPKVCYAVGNDDISISLIHERAFSSSIVLHDSTLWITGDKIYRIFVIFIN